MTLVPSLNSKALLGSPEPEESAIIPIRTMSNSPNTSMSVKTILILTDSEIPQKLMKPTITMNTSATATVGTLMNCFR
jgi:hypothetical protein